MANKPAAAKPTPSPYPSRMAALCVADAGEEVLDFDD